MLTTHKTDTLDLPELEPYRTMRRAAEHERRGIFVAEGEKVVQRLLHTSFEIISVLVTEDWLARLEARLAERPGHVQAYVAPKALLETMVGFQLYHGVLALAKIPPPATLESILCDGSRPLLLLAADGLTSAENLGVVVRNCAAFGVQFLITGETCSSPWLRRAVRNSMGGIFHVPTTRVANLAAELSKLSQSGIAVIAAHPHANGKTLSQADLRQDCCIVLGSEGYGISHQVLQSCSEHVAVPMPWNVDSLNVSSAAAVFLYEAARQRGLA